MRPLAIFTFIALLASIGTVGAQLAPNGGVQQDRLLPLGRDADVEPAIEQIDEPTQKVDVRSDDKLRDVRDHAETPFGADLFRGRFAQETFRGFNPDYAVSVGDRISIKLWGAIDANAVLEVDSQGNVFIPQVGPVNILNVRNSELNKVVTGRIKKMYKDNVGVYASLAVADPVRVFVSGSVDAPGLYAANASDSVLHYLDRAGGIDPDKGSYIDIRVLRAGELHAKVDLYSFLLQGTLPLIQFRDGDTILVTRRNSAVKVTGMVDFSRTFEFEKSVTVGRLLELAGVKRRATHVQIIRNQTAEREAEVLRISEHDLGEVDLVAGDEVNVFEDRRVGAITASLTGEFKGVSQFVLPYNSTLADLLARVETTESSDLNGLQLFRESVAARQKEVLDRMLKKLEESVLSARSGTREEAQLRLSEAKLIKDFISRASKAVPKGQVVLHEGFDPSRITLEDGDVIKIPRTSNTVAVQGEVFLPASFVHQDGKAVEHYLDQAGGLTQPKGSNKIFVMSVNGQVELVQSGLFSRTRVHPGDEILVLPKVELKTFQFTKEVAQVISNIALTAGIVLGI